MSDDQKQQLTRRETLGLSLGGAMAAIGMTNGIAFANKTSPVAPKSSNADASIQSRMLFTWDHSTEWLLNRRGAQTIGASNFYSRDKGAFEKDYTLLLEYCGRHHIDAAVVWGLFRDAHSGIESVKKLCDVAEKNGVRLMGGAGLNAYGGVYYQGKSAYSLDNHLAKHPELKAVRADGRPLEAMPNNVIGTKMFYHACPSRKENQEYIAESLQWLFKNLPLHGVQIEAGDTGVCQCKLCKERRQHPAGAFSWDDFALVYPLAIDAIRSVKPDAWIICETYSFPEPFDGEGHPRFSGNKPAWADECLAKIPEGVFIQWVYDQVPKKPTPRQWTEAGNVDTTKHRHIMRAHYNTYWNHNIRGGPAIEDIAEMAQGSIAHGVDTLSLFGEVSAFHVGAELNYLAIANFGSATNPKADIDVFIRDVAAPLLGDEELARDFLKYTKLYNDPKGISQVMPTIRKYCGSLPAEQARRWIWLGNFLASYAY